MSEKNSRIELVFPNPDSKNDDEFAQMKKRIQEAQSHLSESKMRLKLYNMTTSTSTDTFAINDIRSEVSEEVLDKRTSMGDVEQKKSKRSVKDDKSMHTIQDNNRKDSSFWKKKALELERENKDRIEKIRILEKRNRFSAEKQKVSEKMNKSVSNCKLNKPSSDLTDMKQLVRVSSEKGSSHQLKRESSRNNLYYEYASMKESNSTLKAKLSRVESELDNKKKSLEDLHGKKKLLDRKVQSLNHDKKTISCDYMQLKKDFEEKLSEQRNIFENQFKSELEESKKNIINLKKDLELCGKERDDAVHSMEQNEKRSQQNIEDLKKKLNITEDERNSAVVSLKSNEISFRQEIDELQIKLNTVEGERSKALTSLEHSGKFYEEKIVSLQNELTMVKNECMAKVKSLKSNEDSCRQKMAKLQNELNAIKDEHGKAVTSLENNEEYSQKKIETLECKLRMVENEHSKEVSSLKNDNESSQKKIVFLEDKLKIAENEHKTELSSLKSNENSCRHRINKLQNELSTIEEDHKKAINSLEHNDRSSQRKIKDLENKLIIVEGEKLTAVDALERNERSCRHKIDELQEKLLTVETERDKNIKSSENKAKALHQKIEGLEKDLKTVRVERNRAFNSLENKDKSYKKKVEELEHKLNTAKAEKDISLSGSERSDKISSQKKINELEDKIVLLKGHLEDSINESKVQIEQLRDAIDIAYVERSTVVIEYDDYKKNAEEKLIGYDDAKSRAESLMCVNKSLQRDLNYVHENYKKCEAQLKIAKSNAKEMDGHQLEINKLKDLKKDLLEQVEDLETEKNRSENELKAQLELHLIEMRKEMNVGKQLESANMGVFSTSSCSQSNLEELSQCKKKITGLESKLINESQKRLHDRKLFKNILHKNQKIFDNLDKNLQTEIKKSETLKEKVKEMEELINSQQAMVKKTYNTHIEVAALKRERDNLRKQISAGNWKLELEVKDLKAECESLQKLLDLRNEPDDMDAIFEGLPNVKKKIKIKNNDDMTSKSAEDIIKLNKENKNSLIKDERLGKQKRNKRFGSKLKLMTSCLEEESGEFTSKSDEDLSKPNDENKNPPLKDESLGTRKRNSKFGSSLKLMPSFLEEENE